MGQDSMIGSNTYAFASDRNIVLRHRFDPKNNLFDSSVGAHEAYHLNQNAMAPHWLYLRIQYPDYRRSSDVSNHDSRLPEQFPVTHLK